MNSILMIDQGTYVEPPHQVHDLFSVTKNLFKIYGQVTIEQVTLLSTELHSSGNEVDISKDECLNKCFF